MANWKKMAEAFGRAFGQSVPRFGDDLSKSQDAVLRAYTDKHLDDDVGNAFRKGSKAGEQDRFEAMDRADANQRPLEKELDNINDERTDKTLTENRKQEWDDALGKAEQRSRREAYGDDWWDDYAKEGADDFGNRLREVINEMKTKGISENDILDILKRYGNK